MAELEKVIDQVLNLQLLQINIEEIRLHPDDYEDLRMQTQLKPGSATVPIDVSFSTLGGVKVVQDETVQKGKMHVVKSKPLGECNAQTQVNEASDVTSRPNAESS